MRGGEVSGGGGGVRDGKPRLEGAGVLLWGSSENKQLADEVVAHNDQYLGENFNQHAVHTKQVNPQPEDCLLHDQSTNTAKDERSAFPQDALSILRLFCEDPCAVGNIGKKYAENPPCSVGRQSVHMKRPRESPEESDS